MRAHIEIFNQSKEILQLTANCICKHTTKDVELEKQSVKFVSFNPFDTI